MRLRKLKVNKSVAVRELLDRIAEEGKHALSSGQAGKSGPHNDHAAGGKARPRTPHRPVARLQARGGAADRRSKTRHPTVSRQRNGARERHDPRIAEQLASGSPGSELQRRRQALPRRRDPDAEDRLLPEDLRWQDNVRLANEQAGGVRLEAPPGPVPGRAHGIRREDRRKPPGKETTDGDLH